MSAPALTARAAPAAPAGGAGPRGFGIYLHWPFCLSKCPYCDFNSHVRESVDQARWRAALAAELAHYAALAGPRRVTSVFFGGGTPSLMPPETVAALLERIAELWPLEADLEVSLEANPGAVDAARFAGYAAAGVNRLSLGVQALNDADLRFLGRRHSAAEALRALELARRSFPRVSCDLIYARPGQSRAAWRDELGRALAFEAEHLSLYQLTIEEGTVFHGAWRRGELRLPEADTGAALFELTQELTAAAGRPAYEISNHARPGAACRHNLTYWRYGDYLGVGPGAHGRLTVAGADGTRRLATRQHRAPEVWLERVERSGHATQEARAVEAEEARLELVMMGLRLVGGIARADFEATCGAPPEALLPAPALRRLGDAGYLELDARGLRATAAGRQRLNALLGALLA